MARSVDTMRSGSASPRSSAWADLSLYLSRAKWLMGAVAALILAGQLALLFIVPGAYEARAVLAVSPYEDGASGAAIRRSEASIVLGEAVRTETLSRFPLARLYPDNSEAEAAFAGALTVTGAERPDAFTVRFQHREPALAREVVNAVIGSYLQLRGPILASNAPPVADQPDTTGKLTLLQAEADIRAFLKLNDIADFESEWASAESLQRLITGEMLIAETRANAIKAQMSALQNQRRQTPKTIEIFRENTTQQTLLDLKLQRQDMLTRYTPQSEALKLIDKRIAQVENYLAANQTLAQTVRNGPNPVYQSIEATLIQLNAELVSRDSQIADFTAKLAPITSRLDTLNTLRPQWAALQNARRTATRAVDAPASEPVPANPAERVIEVIEPVSISQLSGAPSALLLLGVCLIAALVGLFVGLINVLRQKGMAGPKRLEQETGLPVIAAVERR
ncbi:MAG: hypothetical protein AAF613_09300 [Pseudomonadota bacterium]